MIIAVILYCIAFAALWQSYREPQLNLSFLSENVTALTFLMFFVGTGGLLIAHLEAVSHSDFAGIFLLLLLASWGVLTLLWFLRKHPADKKPPDIILHPFGRVDKGLLVFSGICVLLLA